MTTAAGSAEPVQKVPYRALITTCAMMASLMQVLDSTIVTVSLPYMQGGLSATSDEITWVLTSYVTAVAVMTAPVGWLAHRFGRKNLFIGCLLGFTVTSMMCGAAQSLTEIVLFRIAQGICGAALVPLAQATMLDIYPFEMRAHAMAIFGIGVMVGPIMGPTVGGWLTDTYSWRWAFYVNLPIGILASTGLALYMPRSEWRPELRFDWTGFAVLALGIGCLQLMLDRGLEQDWFDSREIISEATLAGLGFYLFLVHMFTADRPFLPRGVFLDRNFIAAALMMFCTGMVLLATSVLLAPYLQNLADYPVSTAGLALAPRGFGTMASMFLASRLAKYIDQRILMAFGLLLLGWNLQRMSGWTPDVSGFELTNGLVTQGFAVGFVFNPMTVMAFTTLAVALRGYATSLQSLCRNIGQAVGVSVTSLLLVRGMQASHADIAGGITPFDRVLQAGDAASRMLNPETRHGVAMLDQMINQQAQIIAYNNDFRAMALVVVPPLLLLLVMRRHERPPAATVGPTGAAAAPAGGD